MSIFDEQISRKPNKYLWVDKFIEAMHSGFWTDKEFCFASDKQDFKVLMDDQEREIITKTLSAIAQIEVAVKTFWGKLGDNLPHPSIQDLGYVLANTEVIHNRAYERLLQELNMEHIFEENLKLECIQNRVKYLRKYTHKYYKDSKKQYLYAIILFTLFVENVSLFSQFYIISWFARYKNYLKDTNQQVSYTRQEEFLHANVGIQIINTIREELPELFDSELEYKIIDEASEALKAESKIIDWIIGDWSDNRISAAVLKEYIKGRLNESLEAIGFQKPFVINQDLKRDFEWADEELYANGATDFFFSRPINYSRSVIINEEELV